MGKHKATKCRVYKNDALKTEMFNTLLVKPNEATDPPDSVKVPFTSGLVGGQSYVFEAIHVSDTNQESEAATKVFTPDGIAIQAPVITNPTLNFVLAKGAALTINLSSYLTAPPGATDTPHTATEYLVSTSTAFSSNLIAKTATASNELLSLTIPATTFAANTTYYIKAAFKSNELSSPYSDIVSFKTAAAGSDIEAPTLTSPAILDCKNFALISSAFNPLNANASAHTSTVWNVAKDIDFQQMILNNESPTYRTNITVSGNLLTPGTIYFVKLQYKSGIYSSDWSQTYQVQTSSVAATYVDKGNIPTGYSALGSLNWRQDGGLAALIGFNFLDGNADGSLINIASYKPGTSSWSNNIANGTALSADIIKILEMALHNKCAVLNNEPYFTYITQGSASLSAGDNLLADQPCFVFGATGEESVVIPANVKGVLIDQNIATVALPLASTAYLFQKSGNSLRLFNNNELICTIFPNSTRVSFINGFVFTAFVGTDMQIGGVSVPSTPSLLAISYLDPSSTYSVATLTANVNKHLTDASVSFTAENHKFCKLSSGVVSVISSASVTTGAQAFQVKGADSRYVYAIAGTSAPYRTFKRCDSTTSPMSSGWSDLATIPADCELDSKLIDYGTKMYGYGSKLINGNKVSAFFEYDKTANSWNVTSDSSTGFFFRKDAAVEIVGDFFYVHGGRNALTNTETNELWRRSLVLNAWSQLSSGGETISRHVAYSKDMVLYLVGASKTYSIDCAAIGGSCVTVEDPDAVIGEPVISTPSEGQTFQLITGEIKVLLGAFTVTPQGGDIHKRTRYQFFDNPDIENTVPLLDIDSPSYLLSYYPLASTFTANKTYYVRAMFIGENTNSPWSTIKSFKTSFSYNAPKIVKVGTVTNVDGLSGSTGYVHDPTTSLSIQSSPLSTTPPGAVTHSKSRFQVALNNNFTESGMIFEQAPTSGDLLIKQIVPSANFGNNYGATFGIRVMYNDNNIWSDPVTFKTADAKGWVTLREYRDDMQTQAASFLNGYIRRYRCIGLRSRTSSDAALFVIGAEGKVGNTWKGREYPMDGSSGREINTDVVEYCNFVYCDNYIYRINFKYDGGANGAKIHRLALSTDLNSPLENWEEVATGTPGKIYNENISVFVSRKRIFIYAREEALVNGVPRIGIFMITPSSPAASQVTKKEILYTEYPNTYFKVDNVISIAQTADAPSTESCILTRIYPATAGGTVTLDPNPESKGYKMKLCSYSQNVWALDQLQNVYNSEVLEPQTGWNVIYDPEHDLLIYNTYSSSSMSLTLVDPNKLNLGNAGAAGTVMNGYGPIPNPIGAIDPMRKVIIHHYHDDVTPKAGLYCFGGLVTSLSTNRFYLKKFV